MCEQVLNVSLQIFMHSSDKSTKTSFLHSGAKKRVHLPWPGAISKMVSVGTKACIRDNIVKYHSMSVPPHAAAHSSPVSFHSFHILRFFSIVAMGYAPDMYKIISN